MTEKHFFGQWHCSESRVYVFVSQQLVHAIFKWHQIFIGAESRPYGNDIFGADIEEQLSFAGRRLEEAGRVNGGSFGYACDIF
jgi:hypothetical protein